MGKHMEKEDVKAQIWLWVLALAAAVVAAVRNPLAAFIVMLIIGFVWDKLDLTLGVSRLRPSFLPVTGALLGGLALAGGCLLVYRSRTGGEIAVWDVVRSEFERQMQDKDIMSIIWAVVGVALIALMYLLIAFFVTVILAFSQRAATMLLGRGQLPYGGLFLMVAWALPCFVWGAAAGAVALLLSVIFGLYYLLVQKNSIVTYFTVLFCLLSCFLM